MHASIKEGINHTHRRSAPITAGDSTDPRSARERSEPSMETTLVIPRAVIDVLRNLPDEVCRRVELPDGSVIAIRHKGQLHCYRNRCPHRGTELDWAPGCFLNPTRTHLQCATHGALFDIASGRCVAGPCVGEALQRLPSSSNPPAD